MDNNPAIYPGTFDPLTLGHLDLVQRAAKLFPRVVVSVAASSRKNVVFSLDERVEMVRAAVEGLNNVSVESFEGLLINYARRKGAHVIIRGLRAFSDFEYELQLALTNRKLAPEVEAIYLMPKADYSYISSSMVREVASLGGEIEGLVPPAIRDRILARMQPDSEA